MLEYGIDKVRGGSYLEGYNLPIENSSLQNEMCFPLRFLKSNEILQETYEAIKELDLKFELKKDKIHFIENKLQYYIKNVNEIEYYSDFQEKGKNKINLLESMIPSMEKNQKEIELIMEYLNAFITNNNRIDYEDELIKKSDLLVDMTHYLSFVSKEGLYELCKQYSHLYDIIINYISDIQFKIDIESLYLREVADMLLFHYSSSSC